MQHDCENEILCPYCDARNGYSRDAVERDVANEAGEQEGTCCCGSCGKRFTVTRIMIVAYSTRRMNCEQNNTEHDYQFIDTWIKRQGVSPKDKEYRALQQCSHCGDEQCISLSRDEWDRASERIPAQIIEYMRYENHRKNMEDK